MKPENIIYEDEKNIHFWLESKLSDGSVLKQEVWATKEELENASKAFDKASKEADRELLYKMFGLNNDKKY
jgi:hypothetical protein